MFARVAIVGVGLIGGSLGMALRERGLAETIVGVGRNPKTLQRAVDRGAIHLCATDFNTGVAGADAVVLATPIPQILRDLERLPSLLAPGAIVTDVGSTKQEIARAGERFLPTAFVGSHPMAGSEKAGVEFARADLFEAATWVVTPLPSTPFLVQQAVEHLAAAVGAQVRVLSPETHDRVVAVTSHLPHVLAYTLAALAARHSAAEPQLLDISAGSFASGTRVAESSPELWCEIALSNRQALLATLREYQTMFSEVIDALDNEDEASLLKAFDEGHRLKRL